MIKSHTLKFISDVFLGRNQVIYFTTHSTTATVSGEDLYKKYGKKWVHAVANMILFAYDVAPTFYVNFKKVDIIYP